MQSAGSLLLNKSYFEDLMYGRVTSCFWGLVLDALSRGYGIAIRIRRALYSLRFYQSKELSLPVISVGNITLGGTGKTPTVIGIGALLLQEGKRPAVISRGYGRTGEGDTLVVSDGRTVLVDAQTGGDEPVLIGSKLPGAPVIVGKNRYLAAQKAVHLFRPDVLLLDDGYQHIQLNRTLDIVLVDAEDPFGNGRLFPAGILREPVSALNRAHAVLITKGERTEDMERVKKIIAQQTEARIFSSQFLPLDVIDCCSGDRQPLSFLQGARVLMLAGIARPASLAAFLKSLGASVVAESIYPDHYVYEKSDLAACYKKAIAENADIILTTEKDAVRLKPLKPRGIYALSIELSVHEREEWNAFILAHV